VDNPIEQHHDFSVSIADATDIQPARATLKLPQYFTQGDFQRLLGSAYFSENAALVLYVEDLKSPLIITPPNDTFIGRHEEDASEEVQINLATYGDPSQSVSRLHAVLRRGMHVIAVEDLGSTNGTYVNGQQLTPHVSQVLHDGDVIKLGGLHIRITFQYG
jgi:pSer/pThr/pTyr-binding forkhead associated (FHA) protein